MLIFLIFLLILQRLYELQLAGSNTAHLKRRGAVEHGASHYPLMVLLHSFWILFTLVEWWTGTELWGGTVVTVGWVLLLCGQGLRLWTIRTLGRRWTTRVLVLPGAPLIKEGPFRFLSHPNYLGVSLELFGLPLIGGCWKSSLLFGFLNLALLRHRIRVEERAWSEMSA